MIHYMKLFAQPFEQIQTGKKTIELRLNDEKRQKIAVGDTIVFSCVNSEKTLTAKVLDVHRFPTFRELYKALPLDKCGYLPWEIADAKAEDMYAYYTFEQEKTYGVLGIELVVEK